MVSGEIVKRLGLRSTHNWGCRGLRPCRSARCPRALLSSPSGPAAHLENYEWISDLEGRLNYPPPGTAVPEKEPASRVCLSRSASCGSSDARRFRRFIV